MNMNGHEFNKMGWIFYFPVLKPFQFYTAGKRPISFKGVLTTYVL